MRTLIEAIDQRVLLTDGSLSRRLRGAQLNVARDLNGVEDCLELLNLTRAQLVREGHRAYLRAGADVIRTNSLQASPLTLARWGLGDQAFYINYAAAELACEAVDSVPGRGRRRFVLGVVRDQGWDAAPKDLEDAVAVQVEGLLAGGVDGVAIDMVPGTGRSPAFLRGARRAKEKLRALAPVFLQRGHQGVEFSERSLELADGLIRYRHGGSAKRDWLRAALAEEVNLVGGGDSLDATVRLDRALRAISDDGWRPFTGWRRPEVVDQVTPPSSSLHLDPEMADVA
ncbi:Homocysteine S-methyltransferase [Tistlia consotensis]|uniref:Homocysteine S-methyltransferase n=1 Tax=Tistlia consotensis USBA 355 TaxID=560819 RepID=A0A1Y6CPV8_9PROT|nr:homocysteine S-methyltransferase family protein [Tistlia consotensis]SMF82344.1 Homocysteine S-methyltransferase [Tistlia consotensis USBA 355]SNS27587.1 Homocysteine S-methyltransferase [Tistlia consotensis]